MPGMMLGCPQSGLHFKSISHTLDRNQLAIQVLEELPPHIQDSVHSAFGKLPEVLLETDQFKDRSKPSP